MRCKCADRQVCERCTLGLLRACLFGACCGHWLHKSHAVAAGVHLRVLVAGLVLGDATAYTCASKLALATVPKA
jgi:hypothetical protein